MEIHLPALWIFAGGGTVFLAFAARTLTRKWHTFRRLERARRGERNAISLLRRRGYRVIELQAHRSFTYLVDGVRQKAHVRCDVIAKKRGKTYVVEVKTGQEAHPGSVSTRRQLAEYWRVFEADGLLLADMDRNQLHTLAFERPRREHSATLWLAVGLGFALGVLAARTLPELLVSGRAPRSLEVPLSRSCPR